MNKILGLFLIIGIFIPAVSAVCLLPNGQIDWSKYGQGADNTCGNTAGTVDKDIETITNCYNLTVHYTRSSGNYTPIYFKDCTDIGGNTWTCDCKDTTEYHLILQTDGTSWDKERDYKFTVDYNYYDISEAENVFTVRDWGDNYDVLSSDITDMGKNVIVLEKPVYINQTVYVDRIINQTVYQDRIVPQTIYMENLTHVNSVQGELTKSKHANTLKTILLVLSIIVNILFAYYLFKKPREGNDEVIV